MYVIFCVSCHSLLLSLVGTTIIDIMPTESNWRTIVQCWWGLRLRCISSLNTLTKDVCKHFRLVVKLTCWILPSQRITMLMKPPLPHLCLSGHYRSLWNVEEPIEFDLNYCYGRSSSFSVCSMHGVLWLWLHWVATTFSVAIALIVGLS